MTDEQPLPIRLFHLGLAYHKAGDMAQAENWYKRALSFAPAYPDAWNNLGIIAQNCHNVRAAMDFYLKALECNHRFAPSWSNLGALFEQCGRSEEAARVYEIGLSIDPRAEVWANLGSLYRENGKFDEARRCYEQALKAQTIDDNMIHIHSSLVFTVEQDPGSTLAQRAAVKAAFRGRIG